MGSVQLAAAAIALLPSSAFAADICRATVVHSVRANEEPNSILRPGSINTAIAQFTRDRRTGVTSYCSHGGYCYPTHVIVRGRRVEAQRLLNCSVDMAHPVRSGDKTIYALTVDRQRNSPQALRIDDANNRLLEMGMCSACAGTAAEAYVRRPTSACGTLTRQALEGNPIARRRLVDGENNACTAEWGRR